MSDCNSNSRSCSFPGCTLNHHANGFCHAHYRQAKNRVNLKPVAKRRPIGSDPIIDFSECECENKALPEMCHVFIGCKNKDGYGVVRHKGKMKLVHRYIWEKKYGPIPDGMVVDHMCRNRSCCNTNHLRLVTKSVNGKENIVGSAWQVNATKTHCPKGHPYNNENTYIIPSSKARMCRICIKKYRRFKKHELNP